MGKFPHFCNGKLNFSRLLKKQEKYDFNILKEIVKVLTERLDAYNFEGCEHLEEKYRKDLP